MGDGVHEVGLAEAALAVEEERVVLRPAVGAGGGKGGGVGESVAVGDEERIEGEERVQAQPRPGKAGDGSRRVDGVESGGGSRRRGRIVGGTGVDLEGEAHGPADDAGEGLGDEGVEAGVEPFGDEVGGDAKREDAVIEGESDSVAEPGFEVGTGDLELELPQCHFPQRPGGSVLHTCLALSILRTAGRGPSQRERN